MSTQQHGPTTSAPSAAIVTWQTERLTAAGLPAALARSIAADSGYVLHALLSLVDYGCPAELATRIIAPLEETTRPC